MTRAEVNANSSLLRLFALHFPYLLLNHCLKPASYTPPSSHSKSYKRHKKSHKRNKSFESSKSKAPKNCLTCKKPLSDLVIACPAHCQCEDCAAVPILTQHRTTCLICQKPYYIQDLAGLFRHLYGVCCHCGGPFRREKERMQRHCGNCVQVEAGHCWVCETQRKDVIVIDEKEGKSVERTQ